MNSARDIITSKVRGTIALSGQDISNDVALNQRFIPIKINESTRDGRYYDEINDNKERLSYAAHEVLTNLDKIEDYISKNFKAERKLWKETIPNDRFCANLAIITCFAKSMNIMMDSEDFSMKEWAIGAWNRIFNMGDDVEFLEDLGDILVMNEDKISMLFNKCHTDEEVFMSFSRCYAIFAEYKRKSGENIMSKDAIKDEMYNNGLITREGVAKIAGTSTRGVYLKAGKVPVQLKDLLRRHVSFKSDTHKFNFPATG